MLEELCGQMGIINSQEVQEFALFLIKGEGESGVGEGRATGMGLGGSLTCQFTPLPAASVLEQQGGLWAALA